VLTKRFEHIGGLAAAVGQDDVSTMASASAPSCKRLQNLPYVSCRVHLIALAFKKRE
jgi:hypothetical protein